MKKYMLAQNRWHGEEPAIIEVPDSWEVHYAKMRGDDYPAMKYEDIQNAIRNPIGVKPLRELAKERENAIILFENMSRGADVKSMAHAVLEELLSGGMSRENILFMCATATHGPLEDDDFAEKLGRDIVGEYLVYNHNCWTGFETVGKSSRGLDIEVNETVMRYDLKIALGGMVPHPMAGFAGGSKIILPGVCSMKTISGNHKLLFSKQVRQEGSVGSKFTEEFGNLNNVDVREDSEEAAMMVGLDFLVNTMYNTKTETVVVVAGHPLVAYYNAIPKARDVYHTDDFNKVDVCILNANAKSNEQEFAKIIGEELIKPGGDVVVVTHAISGHVNHYGVGIWGPDHSGYFAGGKVASKDPGTGRVIIFSPYKSKALSLYFGRDVIWCTTWEQVLEVLADRGAGTSCAIIPDATIQLFRDNDTKFDYVSPNLKKYIQAIEK